jgi:hypothetical protein
MQRSSEAAERGRSHGAWFPDRVLASPDRSGVAGHGAILAVSEHAATRDCRSAGAAGEDLLPGRMLARYDVPQGRGLPPDLRANMRPLSRGKLKAESRT